MLTDHKPLVGIFNKPMQEVENPRLLRLREKLSAYIFTVKWTAGKHNLIADALSRAPYFPPDVEDKCVTTIDTAAVRLHHLAAANDDTYNLLIQCLTDGKQPKEKLKEFKAVYPYLATKENVVYFDNHRIVIPRNKVKCILSELHKSHCGFQKTYTLAKQLYYWPNMRSDIANLCNKCTTCAVLRPSQPTTPMSENKPSQADGAPMRHVATDLFHHNDKNYLVAVDRYSGYLCADILRSTTTSAVTTLLSKWFNTLGWPESIRSDGGPQFLTEFDAFCSEHGIKHELSPAYSPQSNGLAEAAVKNAKHLLIKSCTDKTDYQHVLYLWRNMPRADGVSPAELLFNRRQIINTPTIEQHHTRQVKRDSRDKKYEENRRSYNLSCLLYTSPSPRDGLLSRMPSSA